MRPSRTTSTARTGNRTAVEVGQEELQRDLSSIYGHLPATIVRGDDRALAFRGRAMSWPPPG